MARVALLTPFFSLAAIHNFLDVAASWCNTNGWRGCYNVTEYFADPCGQFLVAFTGEYTLKIAFFLRVNNLR